MYHLISHPDHKLVSIVKGTDPQYVNFVRQGYLCIYSGMRQQVEKKQEEMTAMICQEIIGTRSQ